MTVGAHTFLGTLHKVEERTAGFIPIFVPFLYLVMVEQAQMDSDRSIPLDLHQAYATHTSRLKDFTRHLEGNSPSP